MVEAFLSLIEEGDPAPTATSIASRAGVSRRSVFAHFKDLEQVYAEAGLRQGKKLAAYLTPVDAGLDFDARLSAFVERRCALLEIADPVARAARLREPFSEQLRANRDSINALANRQTEETFATELDQLGCDQRDSVRLALDVASGWGTWYSLRDELRLSPRYAASVLEVAIRRLLTGEGKPCEPPLLADRVGGTRI